MSERFTPSLSATAMRSVRMAVLPQPGGASTRWRPCESSIAACWSGLKTTGAPCAALLALGGVSGLKSG